MQTTILVLACILASRVFAVSLASFLSFRYLVRFTDFISAMACGLLLTISVMHLIPEAVGTGLSLPSVFTVFAAGIIFFCVFERAMERWGGHRHGVPRMRKIPALLGGGVRYVRERCPDHRPVAVGAVLAGAASHNVTDGILIASSFATGWQTGAIVTLTLLLHDVPQLIGQLVLLSQSGMSRIRAVVASLLAALFSLAGALAGMYAIERIEGLLGFVLVFCAASFIYVSIGIGLPLFREARSSGRTLSRLVTGFLVGCVVCSMVMIPLHESAHERLDEPEQTQAHDHGQAPRTDNNGHK